MKHYCGSNHQQRAFGWGIPGIAHGPAVAGLLRQVQGAGEFSFLAFAQAMHGAVQAAGQSGSSVIGIAQLRRREADDRGQLFQIAGCPVGRGRRRGVVSSISHRPLHIGRRQSFPSSVVGITNGHGALRQPLLQSGIGVTDGLGFLGGALAVFRFHRDQYRTDAHFNVNPPSARLGCFRSGAEAQCVQLVGQLNVQGLLVLSRRHVGLHWPPRWIGSRCRPNIAWGQDGGFDSAAMIEWERK